MMKVWDCVGYVLFIFVDMYLWLEAGLLNFFEFLKRTSEGFNQFNICNFAFQQCILNLF